MVLERGSQILAALESTKSKVVIVGYVDNSSGGAFCNATVFLPILLHRFQLMIGFCNLNFELKLYQVVVQHFRTLDLLFKMSTLADELLNDFENSESEGEDEQENGFLQDDGGPTTNRFKNIQHGAEMDVDEEDEEDEDDEMLNADSEARNTLEDAADEEDAKAKVERMQLGGINDVRSVAGLMRTLEPVLEVGYPSLLRSVPFMKLEIYIYFVHIALTYCITSRKSHIISHSLWRSKIPSSAQSKIILNIIY